MSCFESKNYTTVDVDANPVYHDERQASNGDVSGRHIHVWTFLGLLAEEKQLDPPPDDHTVPWRLLWITEMISSHRSPSAPIALLVLPLMLLLPHLL